MALHHFGTDGVRGKYGEGLTKEMAYRIGRYLGLSIDGRAPNIVLSRDTRESGVALKDALIEGIVTSGGEVYDEGVCTTPSISYLTLKHRFDFGVMISASHNPYYDNGIKVFNSVGEKLEEEVEERIESYMDQEMDDLPRNEGKCFDGEFLREEYLNWLLSKVDPRVKGLKVLVDCANGSASTVAPEFFQKAGVQATIMFANPDGKNINRDCGSTHLETVERTLKEGDYDFGFAFDGDADRFLAFRKDGLFLDGDRLIYLNALARHKKGALKGNRVVITVMSNYGLRKALEQANIGMEIVAVGDKNVQACLKEKDLEVGGEQSGHVIFLNELNTGDGFLSCINLMNIAVEDPETLARAQEAKSYPQKLVNLRFESRAKMDAILNDPEIKNLIATVHASLGDTGRVLVRCSGTEPLIRVMAEALDELRCIEAVDTIVKAISEKAN